MCDVIIRGKMENNYKNEFTFFVNGKKVVDSDVDPSLSLLTYLRDNLGLYGSKMGCGEGGCGACTVMVSKLESRTQKIRHFTVNACLAPIGTMHGLAVTTVEGIGSTKSRLHPVQERLAKAHGSQCGFCTPGFVMSMYTLLRNDPEPTMEEIEENLVGNLCRCTGYRPILEGFRTFAKDSIVNGCGKANCCQNKDKKILNGDLNEHDKDKNLARTTVIFDPSSFTPYDPSQEVIFPPELLINSQIYSQSLLLKSSNLKFYRVTDLQDVLTLKTSHPEAKIVVGNTEVGIETKFKNQHYPTIICPIDIPTLTEIEVKDDYINIGAAVTLSELELSLRKFVEELPDSKTKILVSILEMLRWFAGRQIRNVACVGGNIMTGSPISDLNPIFMAAEAKLVLMSSDSRREVLFDDKFYTGYRRNIAKPEEVLVSVKIPLTSENTFFKTFKQARRRDDDIAIVNAAMKVTIDIKSLRIDKMLLAFGGMAPTTVLASQTMKKLEGSTWDESITENALNYLSEELKLDRGAPGGMVDYRLTLTISFFFKFYLYVCQEIHDITHNNVRPLTKEEKELIKPYKNTPTKSVQFFDEVPEGQEEIDLIGRPIPHVSALKQTTGEAAYIDDLPKFDNELHAAFVISTKAHAKILNIDPSNALKLEGVEGFFSAKDLSEEANQTGVIVRDEEVFASKEVHCVGQIIGLVLATNRQLAQKAAKMVEIKYEELPNPIFTIEDAINANSLWDPLIIEDGNIEKGFSDSKYVLEGEIHIGGQEHFYLETNVHIVIPKEDDEIELISSTQGASDLQTLVARTLGIRSNRVYCKVKRIGGGFGGKQSRSILVAIPLAVAASKMKKPVRLLLERDEDMVITGGRNPFLAKWKVGFDDNGKILALNTEFYANAGYCLDLSEAVIMKTVFNVNNVYKIPNLRVKGQCCKTNLPSNTAFRGFGNPQAVFVMENIVTDICNYLHLPQTKVREVNMYDKATQVTHFGQKITKNCARECWKQVCKQSDYEKRLSFVEKFNSENIYKKRGISVIPLKFGVSYEVTFLNQSGALVLVYADGSVLLSHGGMEMGQGLHTKMLQIASRVFEIPIEDIYIAETSTDKVPNTTPTAASVSSDLNGMAVLYACKKILKRIQPYKEKMADKSWKDWIHAAYMDRVSLSATGFYKTPNLTEYDFKEGKPANPFNYFAFGAAASEVEIDCLTGDHTVLRTDIVMDVGKSLNPAIDIGQIEGAFMQGYGLFTLEQLLYTSSGELLTKGPGTYKIPSAHDIPREFNVTLLRESSNDRAVYSSKAVGEPPLLSAVSVFLAIKMAVKSTRKEEVFPFDSPATSERIRMACSDWITNKMKFPTNGPFVPWSMEV
ncbi:UNVERIFIED_CONTAM: hypothetical protein RMT77_003818 [Armadillidium vulgare]